MRQGKNEKAPRHTAHLSPQIMLEKDIENLIAQHPDEVFPKQDFELIAQQYSIEGKRIDILFRDRLNRKVIIEVKRGILNREASGQIGEYYGLLKSKNQTDFYEMILCANVIPKERRLFLESIGIECKELRISFILDLAQKYNYTFIDDQSSFDSPSISSIDKAVSPVNFIDDENNRGRSFLKAIGLNNTDKFVCLCVRDSSYKIKYQKRLIQQEVFFVFLRYYIFF